RGDRTRLHLQADALEHFVAAEALANLNGLNHRPAGCRIVRDVHRCAPIWVSRLTRLRLAARLEGAPPRPAYFFSSWDCRRVDTVVSSRYQMLATISSSITR